MMHARLRYITLARPDGVNAPKKWTYFPNGQTIFGGRAAASPTQRSIPYLLDIWPWVGFTKATSPPDVGSVGEKKGCVNRGLNVDGGILDKLTMPPHPTIPPPSN